MTASRVSNVVGRLMRYALLVMLAVGACGGGRDMAPMQYEGASRPATPMAGEKAPAKESEARPTEPTVDPSERMVIRTATIELRADAPRDVGQAAAKLAEDAGGFVVSTDFSGVGDEVHFARVTLRVPAAKFDATLATLRELGTVLHEAIAGEDVTEEFVDKEAQLRSQRKLEERLLELLGQAANIEETLQVEEQLSRIRMEIERLEGRTRYLKDRVAFSTIEFTARSPDQPVDADAQSLGSRFANAFRESGRAFTHVVTGIIVILGGAVPLALLAGFVWFLVRRFRKRRPPPPASSSTPPQADAYPGPPAQPPGAPGA